MEADALVELGMLEADDNAEQSYLYYQQALKIYQEEGNISGEARVRNNIGIYHFERDELQSAKEYFTQALMLHRHDDDPKSEALLLGNLSNVVMYLGDIAQSIEYSRKAKEIQEHIGDDSTLARTLSNLANTLVYIGQKEEAFELLSRALVLAQQVEHHTLEAEVLEQFVHAVDDIQEREEYLRQVQEHYAEEYELLYQYSFVTSAQLDIEAKRWSSAEQKLRTALQYFAKKDHHYIEQIRIFLALIFAYTGRYEEAGALVSQLSDHHSSPSLQNLFYQTRILEIYILCGSPKAKDFEQQARRIIQDYDLEKYPQSQGIIDFRRVLDMSKNDMLTDT